MNKESINYVYFAIWLTIAAGNLFIFFGSKNAKLKRALLPVIGVLAGVAVLLVLVRADFATQTLFLAVPVVILLIVLNLRQFKICGSCASLVRGEFFGVPKECYKCGANLGDQ